MRGPSVNYTDRRPRSTATRQGDQDSGGMARPNTDMEGTHHAGVPQRDRSLRSALPARDIDVGTLSEELAASIYSSYTANTDIWLAGVEYTI